MLCYFNSGATSVAATGATTITVVQIVAPTNQRVDLLSFSVSFDSTGATAVPARFRLLRQTTAGTFTNATNAPTVADKGIGEAPQTNYQTVATAEPTAGDVLLCRHVPVFMGYYEKVFNPGECVIQGGGRLGFEITAPASVNVRVDGMFRE